MDFLFFNTDLGSSFVKLKFYVYWLGDLGHFELGGSEFVGFNRTKFDIKKAAVPQIYPGFRSNLQLDGSSGQKGENISVRSVKANRMR